MTEPAILQQGASATIRVTDVKDAAGVQLNMTGWAVHAQARPNEKSATVFAEWHSTPTGEQLQATAGNGEISLTVPYPASTLWTTWAGSVADVGVEVTEPGVDGRRVSFERRIYLNREIVR